MSSIFYDKCLQWWFDLFLVGYFFSFLSHPHEKYSLTFLVVSISTLAIILLIFNFWFWPFCRSFICFQFHPSIPIYHILYSPIWSSFFSYFFSWLFHKRFTGFQFYYSIQIDGIIFSNLIIIDLIMIFFIGSSVKVTILFNITLQ
jgi:hypothetical protein